MQRVRSHRHGRWRAGPEANALPALHVVEHADNHDHRTASLSLRRMRRKGHRARSRRPPTCVLHALPAAQASLDVDASGAATRA
jgi:hypothetical protein